MKKNNITKDVLYGVKATFAFDNVLELISKELFPKENEKFSTLCIYIL